jgi:PAS domain S-box-containing protein
MNDDVGTPETETGHDDSGIQSGTLGLRGIVAALALMALLATAAGGWLYHRSLHSSAVREAGRRNAVHAAAIHAQVSSYLEKNLAAVGTLAGLDGLSAYLAHPTPRMLEQVETILDHFRESFEVSVCYLMDDTGLTLASTNRNDPDSFVGKNYGFRPYFRQALAGAPAIYMARGVTSGQRGIYSSHPVRAAGRDQALGVVVIKAPLDPLETGLDAAYPDIWLLTGPGGVIFATNLKAWRYRTLWPADSAAIEGVARSRQFGNGPFLPTGLRPQGDDRCVDPGGTVYQVRRLALAAVPGWDVVYLTDVSSVVRNLSDPLLRISRPLIIMLVIFVGTAVLLLYLRASSDIRQRRRLAAALARQNLYLSALHQTTVGIINRLEMSDLLETVLDRAVSMTGTEHGYIYLLTPDGSSMEMRHARGFFAGLIGLTVRPGEGLGGKVWETGRPLIVADYRHWVGRLVLDGLDRLRSVVGIPLISEGFVVGVIGIGFLEPNKQPGTEEMRALTRLAELAAIAMDNARLVADIRHELAERMRAEAALRDSEERFRTAFQTSPDAIHIVSLADRRYVDVNDGFTAVTGYGRAEVAGRPVNDFPLCNDPGIRGGILATLEREGDVRDVEIRLRTRTEEVRTGLVSGRAITLGGSPHALIVIRDISDWKQAQAEMRKMAEADQIRRERLDAAIEMAGAVCHEMNQPLMALYGYAELIMRRLDPEDPTYQAASGIAVQVDRVAELTRKLMGMSSYETKPYLKGRIMDIHKAAESSEPK